MSIDFSKIAKVGDKYGAVVQIADSDGHVLWRHNHNFLLDWVIDIAATCVIAGRKHRVCSTCGHIETAVIPAAGHKNGDPVLVRVPTCTKPSEYAVYCTVCKVEVDRYENDGEFAEHIPDGGRETTKPTCTTTGVYTYYCRECGTWVKADTIPALGHVWGNPYYSSEFSSGYGQKCTVCGQLEELAYVECEHPASAYHESVITNPTCTVPGSKTCSCDVCRQSWTVSIPALGHSYTSEVIAPTCTEKGYTKHTCSRCGHWYTDNEKDPNGHNFMAGWVVINAATCTGTGTERRTCLTCGHYEDRTIPAKVHSYTSRVVAPTCTAKGYTTHTCSVCGHSYTDSETAALGHKNGNPVLVREATCTVAPEYAVYCTVCGVEVDRYEDDGGLLDHVADGGRVTKEPTCTATGIRKYYCRECGAWVREEVIPANGHSYTSVVVSPTCTTKGYTTHTCSVCSHSFTDSETAALGHKSGSPVLTREPTCTVPAQYAIYCTRCNVELNRYEDDGEFADHIADGGRITKYATCTDTGVYTHRCRECDTWLRDEVIAALGHDYQYDYTEDATCEEGGYDVYTCTRCSDWYTTNETEAKGHSFPDVWVTETEPTCEKTGTERRYCTNCDNYEERDIPTIDHDYEAIEDSSQSSGYVGVCRVCGHVYEDYTH